MKMIPLYDPLPTPPVPAELCRRHYMDEIQKLELTAHAFFGLDKDIAVLAVDRATHGLELCYLKLVQILGWTQPNMVLPGRTYRAAADMAEMIGHPLHEHLHEEVCGEVPPMHTRTHSITVPTTLGGTMPKAELMPKGCAVVYDCAHTCHPMMFEELNFTDTHFAVLSFYPTKPAGAFGGGLIVGKKRWIEEMRAWVVPMDGKPGCMFYYPQTVQAWAMRHRLDTYDLKRQTSLRKNMLAVIKLLKARCGVVPVFPNGGKRVISPHLLAYRRTTQLAQACLQAGLETGSHYPHIDPSVRAAAHLTLPFHSPEVVERLQEVL